MTTLFTVNDPEGQSSARLEGTDLIVTFRGKDKVVGTNVRTPTLDAAKAKHAEARAAYDRASERLAQATDDELLAASAAHSDARSVLQSAHAEEVRQAEAFRKMTTLHAEKALELVVAEAREADKALMEEARAARLAEEEAAIAKARKAEEEAQAGPVGSETATPEPSPELALHAHIAECEICGAPGAKQPCRIGWKLAGMDPETYDETFAPR